MELDILSVNKSGTVRIEFTDFIGTRCALQESIDLINPKLNISILESANDTQTITLTPKEVLALLPFLVNFAQTHELLSAQAYSDLIENLSHA